MTFVRRDSASVEKLRRSRIRTEETFFYRKQIFNFLKEIFESTESFAQKIVARKNLAKIEKIPRKFSEEKFLSFFAKEKFFSLKILKKLFSTGDEKIAQTENLFETIFERIDIFRRFSNLISEEKKRSNDREFFFDENELTEKSENL